MITRRSFIKNVSLSTLLLATGTATKGLSYTVPNYKLDSHEDIYYEWGQDCMPSSICVVTVGEIGLAISINLPKEFCSNPYTPNSNTVIQFDPTQKDISVLLDQMDVIFLVGSFLEKDFFIARDVILQSAAKLVITITSNEFDSPFKTAKTQDSKEAIISLPTSSFISSATTTIIDVSSILIIPILVGIDFADITDALQNSKGTAFSVASSYQKSVETSKRLTHIQSTNLKEANSILAILSYSNPDLITLDDITKIGDEISFNSNNNLNSFCWGCSYNKQLPSLFRLTILPVISDKEFPKYKI